MISTSPMAVHTAAEERLERPSASELRVAQYEKPLTKGHRPKTLRGGDRVRNLITQLVVKF